MVNVNIKIYLDIYKNMYYRPQFPQKTGHTKSARPPPTTCVFRTRTVIAPKVKTNQIKCK
tara:strand:- start:851 stop:1030 length:180 start_codon:yes stop_codon:yes gene_type:complete